MTHYDPLMTDMTHTLIYVFRLHFLSRYLFPFIVYLPWFILIPFDHTVDYIIHSYQYIYPVG